MGTANTFYTYLWLRENGIPYYVGKGKEQRAYRRSQHRVKCPPRERILVEYHASEQDAFAAEIFLIAYYGRIDLGTGCLRNLTDGGDGCSGLIHSIIDLTGKRFGLLRVVKFVNRSNGAIWRCVCDCGAIKDISSSNLPRTSSCGCTSTVRTSERMAAYNTTHPVPWNKGKHGPTSATHCKRGHEFSSVNTYLKQHTDGRCIRHCRECMRLGKRNARHKQRHSSTYTGIGSTQFTC